MKPNLINKGKVRDIYEVLSIDNEAEYLLMVASDRISAFDIVLPQLIPEKGKTLTEISNFWMNKTSTIVQNHLVENVGISDLILPEYPDLMERCVLVKKLRPIMVEFVIRGYLSGSAWEEYKEKGEVQGYKLPKGLVESDRLPYILFTPTTKARVGKHDIPLTMDGYMDLMRRYQGVDPIELVEIVEALYEFAARLALEKGIIIADTKLELGLDKDNNVYLIDEAFTPDSSRFWPANAYIPGQSQFSFDKQFIRDYLKSTGWDRLGAPPDLAEYVIAGTTNKYRSIRNILLG